MKRVLSLLIALIMIVSLVAVLGSCGSGNTDGGKEGETVNNEESNTPEKKVFLESLTLDDSRYTIGTFDPKTNEYKVDLPAGRPAVPRVVAKAADGVDVKITQAAIPDSANGGKATVLVTDAEGNTNTYTVEFTRDIKNGFVLQYDDRYQFVHTHTIKEGTEVTYESDNEAVVSVDKNGKMTAKKLSETPVTITAKIGDTVTDTLKIDRVEKAHINLFLITGQSNGQGCYDTTNYGKDIDYLLSYDEQLENVEPIGGMGRVYSYDVFPLSRNTEVYKLKGKMYDMGEYRKAGHQASLGKAFYDLSGEKVVFLQSAYSGAPIESWLDPKKHDEAGTYGGGQYFYIKTQEGYKKLTKLLAQNYEIVLVGNFWCQGETAMSAVYDQKLGDYIFSGNAKFNKADLITDETYYKYFMMLHEDMKKDFGVTYNGIMMVRTKGGSGITNIVPVVSAHFALINNNDEIHLATRKFIEIAKQYKDPDKTAEGYGYMGTDNNHYNQIGYNYHGKEAGTNAFYAIFGPATNKSEGIEIIAQNGTERLDAGDTLTLRKGQTYRLGALSLPHYINEKLTWTSANTDVVTVDEFGKVTAKASGATAITVTSESGQKQTVMFTVK